MTHFMPPETGWILKRPSRAIRLYYGRSRAAAVAEKCIDCVGSPHEAKRCPATTCPLWPYRPGAERGLVPDFVPAREELAEMARAAQAIPPV